MDIALAHSDVFDMDFFGVSLVPTQPTTNACLPQGRSDLIGLVTILVENPNVAFNLTANCTTSPAAVASPSTGEFREHTSAWTIGRVFYAYFTPLVFTIGLLGNATSLLVFLSRNMRSLSASTYLAALSTSDLMALVFYVLVEWLIRGMPVLQPDRRVTFMHVNGSCQMIMYFHYVSRFLSAWLIVAFTVERYIGVCHPLQRRHICTSSSTKKIILTLVVMSFLINVFKPLLSVVNDVNLWGPMCTTYPEYKYLSFILDSIYAVLITFVPFLIITVLNFFIVRRLFLRNRLQRLCRVVTKESVMRLEFTLILLSISFFFIIFNVPYFVVWCKLFFSSRYLHVEVITDPEQLDYYRGVFLIARAIFYINYCINFFLYSITGAYFRKELKTLIFYRSSSRFSVSGRRKDSSFNDHRYPRGSSRNSLSLRKDSQGSLHRTSTPHTWL